MCRELVFRFGVVRMHAAPHAGAMPAVASSIRLTIRSNYGGSYLGIAELAVMGIGLPPLPGT